MISSSRSLCILYYELVEMSILSRRDFIKTIYINSSRFCKVLRRCDLTNCAPYDTLAKLTTTRRFSETFMINKNQYSNGLLFSIIISIFSYSEYLLDTVFSMNSYRELINTFIFKKPFLIFLLYHLIPNSIKTQQNTNKSGV